jgi:hypothetical protein
VHDPILLSSKLISIIFCTHHKIFINMLDNMIYLMKVLLLLWGYSLMITLSKYFHIYNSFKYISNNFPTHCFRILPHNTINLIMINFSSGLVFRTESSIESLFDKKKHIFDLRFSILHFFNVFIDLFCTLWLHLAVKFSDLMNRFKYLLIIELNNLIH